MPLRSFRVELGPGRLDRSPTPGCAADPTPGVLLLLAD